MSWLRVSAFEPHLPTHCTPETDFLLRLSGTLHICIPTPLALLSTVLGILSIIAWLFAQLPQIYKNWTIQSTSGLSIFFLVEWCLGDVSNLLGALFTHQATWQVAIGAYYVFVDLCLVGQWIWYERLRHGQPVFRIRKKGDSRDSDGDAGGRMEQVAGEGLSTATLQRTDGPNSSRDASGKYLLGVGGAGPNPPAKQPARPQIIFRAPTFSKDSTDKEKPPPATPNGTKIHRIGSSSSSPIPSPSPRTILLIACLVALAQASPLRSKHPHAHPHTAVASPTHLEQAGTLLSWLSTALYLGSRLPQLLKNFRRKSTAGLSPQLFLAAFCGNLAYSGALLTNPCAWADFGAFGGGGWVGAEGSVREEWVLAALPFFLGAAGVLGLDASVGVQFLLYGEAEGRLVVVEEEESRGGARKWHWRRVSGWMRGWAPSETKDGERDALVRTQQGPGQVEGGYGTF